MQKLYRGFGFTVLGFRFRAEGFGNDKTNHKRRCMLKAFKQQEPTQNTKASGLRAWGLGLRSWGLRFRCRVYGLALNDIVQTL